MTKTFSIQHIESQNKTDLVAHIIRTYDIQHAAVVGDRLSDIIAAKTNGLLSIGCRFDFAQEDELKQADFIVNHLVEVQDYIEKVRNSNVLFHS